MRRSPHRSAMLSLLMIMTMLPCFAQSDDRSTQDRHLSGSVLVTNNGISLVPSFSLGEPAAMFNMSLGGEKLSFDPEFRFSLKGKPWAFVFWWRYKLFTGDRFSLQVGAHPAFLFSTAEYLDDGTQVEVLKTNRYLAGEIRPTFTLSKHIDLGLYYLTGHGFDPGVRNTHYLALMANFSDLPMTEHVHWGVAPQLFYLNSDGLQGAYFASGFSLSHDRLPLSLGGMFNQKIRSEIASEDFLWSIHLVYTFSSTYHR